MSHKPGGGPCEHGNVTVLGFTLFIVDKFPEGGTLLPKHVGVGT
jgi:hypothetical protein